MDAVQTGKISGNYKLNRDEFEGILPTNHQYNGSYVQEHRNGTLVSESLTVRLPAYAAAGPHDRFLLISLSQNYGGLQPQPIKFESDYQGSLKPEDVTPDVNRVFAFNVSPSIDATLDTLNLPKNLRFGLLKKLI